jgi:hypothetical protein
MMTFSLLRGVTRQKTSPAIWSGRPAPMTGKFRKVSKGFIECQLGRKIGVQLPLPLQL